MLHIHPDHQTFHTKAQTFHCATPLRILQTESDLFQVNESFSCLHRKIKLPTPVQEEAQCRGILALSSADCALQFYGHLKAALAT